MPEANPQVSPTFHVKAMPMAMTTIRAHAQAGGRDEIIGLLLGKLESDRLLIEHAIEAPSTKQSHSQVTLTADAWAAALSRIDRDHPDSTIVGWYHSHPGHGVFLSEPDLFLHRSFFDMPGQTAVVIDPTTGQCDAFWFNAHKELVQRPLETEKVASHTAGDSWLVKWPMRWLEPLLWFIGTFVVTLALLRWSQMFDK